MLGIGGGLAVAGAAAASVDFPVSEVNILEIETENGLDVKLDTSDPTRHHLTFSLADTLSLDEVQAQKLTVQVGANTIVIDGQSGTIIGLTNLGWDPANIVSGRAATEDQLLSAYNALEALAGTGWNLSAGGGAAVNIGPGGNVNFQAADANITVSQTGTADNGNIGIGLNPDLNVTSVTASGSVTAGSVAAAGAVTAASMTANSFTAGSNILNSTGLTIADGPSLSSSGIDMAGDKITNLSDGLIASGSKDAVTGGQLYDLRQELYSLGSGVKYFHANSLLDDSVASGDDAVAIGPEAVAAGLSSLAAGHGATTGADAEASIAIGRDAIANGASIVAIGDGANVQSEFTDGAIAIGKGARVTGTNSDDAVALGTDAAAAGIGATALGAGATASAGRAIAVGDASASGAASIAVGNGAVAAPTRAISIGSNAGVGTSGGPEGDKTDHIAIGTFAGRNVLGNQNTGIGYNAGTGVTGDNNIAVGTDAGTGLDGNFNVAIGSGANQGAGSVDQATALGAETKAATDAVAVGYGASALTRGVAVGYESSAEAQGLALGNNSQASSGNIALGANSIATAADGLGNSYLTGRGPVDSVVSVGSSGSERRIVNVADGAADTDAVNVNQLKAAQQAVANLIGGNVVADSTGFSGFVIELFDTNNDSHKYETVAEAIQAVANGQIGIALPANVVTKTGSGTIVVADAVDGDEAVNLAQMNAAIADAAPKYFSINSTNGANRNNNGATAAEAIAIGPVATASAVSALAVGDGAAASSYRSTAIGYGAHAEGERSSVLGNESFAYGKGGVAIGQQAISRGNNSIVIGTGAESDPKSGGTVDNAIVIGTSADVTADDGIAIGRDSLTNSPRGIAQGVGASALATDAIAQGTGASASGNRAVASGAGASAAGAGSVATGSDAQAVATRGIAIGDNAVAGNVSATTPEELAANLDALAIGTSALASGKQSMAFGKESKASEENSLAVGTKTQVSGANSSAIGYNNIIEAGNSAALGTGISLNATAENTFAIGNNIATSAANALILGSNVNLVANNSVILGNGASSLVEGGIALGNNSVASRTAAAGATPYIAHAGTAALVSNTVATDAAVSVGSDTVRRQITGVAAGTADTDAVNVAQLKNLANLPMTFTGNTGTAIERKLGETLQIVGAATTAGAYGSSNIRTSTAGNTITIELANSPKFGDVTINADGKGRITGVADGIADTDAVNLGQLEAAAAAATTEVVEGKNVKVSRTVDSADNHSIYTVATADEVEFTKVGVGNTVITTTGVQIGADIKLDANGLAIQNGPSVTRSGIHAGNMVITNVANGVNPNDAVNVSQLTQVANVANMGWNLGAATGNTLNIGPGGSARFAGDGTNIDVALEGTDDDGTIRISLARDIDVDSVTAGDSTLDDDGLTVDDGKGNKTEVASTGVTISSDAGVTDLGAGLVQITGAGSPIIINGNSGTITGLTNKSWDPNNYVSGQAATEDQLAQVSKAANAGWVATDAKDNAARIGPDGIVTFLGDNNITVTQTGTDNNGKVEVALNPNLDVTSVTTGQTVMNNDGVKVGDDVALTRDGLAVGDVAVTENGLVIKDGPSVTTSGIDAGGLKIVNVAAGEISSTSSDAINGSQLYGVADNIANIIGGNAQFNVDTGAIEVSNIGNTGKDNIHDAIDSVRQIASAGWNLQVGDDANNFTNVGPGNTVIFQGDSNITVSLDKDKQEVTVALNPNLDVTSVTTGQTVMNNDGVKVGDDVALTRDGLAVGDVAVTENGLVIKDGPSVTTSGIDAGGLKIVNVAAGEISSTSSDAINGSQLYGVADNIANIIGGNAQFNIDTGGIEVSNIGNTGKDNIHEAIDSVRQTASAGWNLTDESGNEVNIGPNGLVTFLGDSNITVTQTGIDQDGKVVVALNENISVTSVTTGQTVMNNDGIKVGDDVAVTEDGLVIEDGPSVTRDGIDAGDKKITNVAAGEDDTDAVNVSQLKKVEDKADRAVQYDYDDDGNRQNSVTLIGGDPNSPVLIRNVARGTADTDAVNVGQLNDKASETLSLAYSYTDARYQQAINYVDQTAAQTLESANRYTDSRFDMLASDISDVRGEARQAAAIGLAAASLRFDNRPGKLSASVGAGLWRDASAFALGIGYTSEDGRLRSNLSATTAGGDWGIGAGLSFTFN